MSRLWIIALLTMAAFGQTATADFNNRTGGAATPLIGTNDIEHAGTSAGLLTAAGIKISRASLSLAQVWANCPSPCTPTYSSIDGITDATAAAGATMEVYIQLTPPDLGASTCTPPTNNTTWATRAAAAIAHVDARHPGTVVYWGVWNEPDLTGNLCPGSGTNLQAYLPIYAAAAPAMIAQVTSDGSLALVGGPALGSPAANASSWLANTSTGLLGNSGTSPYVQFVDFHSYIGSCTVSWSACFSALQNASTGENALYSSILTLVRAGSQPSASTTPLLRSEFNDSAPFAGDPVRNDATNGPLWNAVHWINALNAGSFGDWYYAAASSGTATYFCQLWDPVAADCSYSGFPLSPTPQYYLYDLLASPTYLGLLNGGHLAASTSPGSSTSGLQSAAFYTSTKDVILTANPTSSDITGVTFTFNNANMTNAHGLSYLLNASNSTITTSAVTLTGITGGYTATATVPALSTLAIAISNTGTQIVGAKIAGVITH